MKAVLLTFAAFLPLGVAACGGGDDTTDLRAQVAALQTQVAPQAPETVLAVARKCAINGQETEGGWYGPCRLNYALVAATGAEFTSGKKFDRLEVTVGRPGQATRVETISPQVQVNVGDVWRPHSEAWVFDLSFRTSPTPPRYIVTVKRGDGSTTQEEFALPAPGEPPQVGGPWPPK